MRTVRIRGKTVRVPEFGTKADIARALLAEDADYTVSEISKAVPMAYSQVHSIKASQHPVAQIARNDRAVKKLLDHGRKETRWPTRAAAASAPVSLKTKQPARSQSVGSAAAPEPRVQARSRATQGIRTSAKGGVPRVGKLRIGGLPSDKAVGECANCGHDLVVRGGPHGYMLIHTNISTEEYLATVQFCNAVPKKLF